MGTPEPIIKNAASPKSDQHVPEHDPPDNRTLSERLWPPLFVAPKTPLQVASAVRRWRDTRLGRTDADCVVNAIGWRILEFIEEGDAAAAEMIVRRLARDASSIHRDEVVADLAEGLRIRGQVKLAALAKALAFTSGRDRWLNFRGPPSLFLDAIQLDRELAWATLAEELAVLLARGGLTFATKRSVELLVADGRLDEAFSCWNRACDVIASRLPRTGPADDIDVYYEPETDNESLALAAAIITRINHLFVQEKRFAVAAAALVVHYEPLVFSSGFGFAAANQVPPWTLITLLHVLFEFEVAPYEATRASANVLRSVAVGEFVSARALARALLDRARLEVPTAPPAVLPKFPGISPQRAPDLAEMIGKQRLRRIERLWPEFEKDAVERIDVVFRSDDLRHRMGRALDRFRLGRRGRHRQVWYPINEEVERVLQITGAAVRGELSKQGIIDPSVEDEMGMQLLGDIETMVRLVLSRVVRPTYAEKIASKALGAHSEEPVALECGVYEGWVVAGFHEMESKIGRLSSIDARITACSGVVFYGVVWDEERLPYTGGDARVWNIGACQTSPSGPLSGPICGLGRITDAFGVSDVLVPHPAIIDVGHLRAVPFDRGLTLVDGNGEPAVACRAWRSRLIGDEYFDDREHRIEGLDLLVRPDIFAAISAIALNSPRLVTVVYETKSGDGERA